MKLLFLFVTIFISIVNAQVPVTPLEQSNFEKITSYEELSKFVELLDQQSDILQNEVIGKSVEGQEHLCIEIFFF